jgi:ribosomal protein S18 acetylase RimI-like enzyme
MIRESKLEDLQAIMQIWFESNIEAHSFVPEEFWKNHYDSVKEAIAKGVTVYEEDERIIGFIGVIDGYIAGLFVAKDCRSLGIGKKLLEDAKSKYNMLELDVYLQNSKAVKFYRRENFQVEKKQNNNTGFEEYHMIWRRA